MWIGEELLHPGEEKEASALELTPGVVPFKSSEFGRKNHPCDRLIKPYSVPGMSAMPPRPKASRHRPRRSKKLQTNHEVLP